MARLLRRLTSGGGWLIESDDAGALGDWASALLTASANAGLGTFEAVLRGDSEACRYALESVCVTSTAVRADRGGTAQLSGVTADEAAALVDAWTDGCDLALVAAASGGRLALRRIDARRLEVLAADAPPAVAAIVAAVPAGPAPGTTADPPDPKVATERAGGARVPRRLRRIGAALAGAAVVGGIAAAGVVWRRAHTPAPAAVASVSPSPGLVDEALDPPPASGSAIAADPTTGGFVVVGCCDPSQPGLANPESIWEWDGETLWQRIETTGTPPPFLPDAVLTYDRDFDGFVLHGGDTDPQTWLFNPRTRRWAPEPSMPQPPAGPAVIATPPEDSIGPRAVVVTGGAGGGDLRTWLRLGGGWRALRAAEPTLGAAPWAFGRVAIGADALHGDVVLVAPTGQGGDPAQTWTFDGLVWTLANPATPLPSDPNTQLAWDATTQRVLAVLPGDSANPLSGASGTAETFAWDGSSWSELSSGGGPGGRGRLLTSSLGVVVYLKDAMTAGHPDVVTWNGSAWSSHPGGAGVVVRRSAPDATALLASHGLTLATAIRPATADQGAAAETAVQAIQQPPASLAQFYVRIASQSFGRVTRTTTGVEVCVCWVLELLTTSNPGCPGLEHVVREAIVAVDPASNRAVEVHDEPAPAGVTFGNCG